MAFEIRNCTLQDVAAHATIHGRTNAKVNVKLREIRAKQVYDHDLVLRVSASTTSDMSDAQIRSMLLGKAAIILNRTVRMADGAEGSAARA
ncbi:MAG: hypothetical protein JWR75_1836 [Devosia sp.]|nr:hypothetical protein [Devosia sp.]